MAAQATAQRGQVESNQATRSNSERIAAIEAILPYLATKADIESLRAEIRTMRWLIVVAIAVTGIVVQIVNQGGA